MPALTAFAMSVAMATPAIPQGTTVTNAMFSTTFRMTAAIRA